MGLMICRRRGYEVAVGVKMVVVATMNVSWSGVAEEVPLAHISDDMVTSCPKNWLDVIINSSCSQRRVHQHAVHLLRATVEPITGEWAVSRGIERDNWLVRSHLFISHWIPIALAIIIIISQEATAESKREDGRNVQCAHVGKQSSFAFLIQQPPRRLRPLLPIRFD